MRVTALAGGTGGARFLLRRDGHPLSRVTQLLCARWLPTPSNGRSVDVRLLPSTDDNVKTHVTINDSQHPGGTRTVHFQKYHIRLRAEPTALGMTLVGGEHATAAPGVSEAIGNADVVLIRPSNPVVSIDTIPCRPTDPQRRASHDRIGYRDVSDHRRRSRARNRAQSPPRSRSTDLSFGRSRLVRCTQGKRDSRWLVSRHRRLHDSRGGTSPRHRLPSSATINDRPRPHLRYGEASTRSGPHRLRPPSKHSTTVDHPFMDSNRQSVPTHDSTSNGGTGHSRCLRPE